MGDILVRICVGACGLGIVVGSMVVIGEGKHKSGASTTFMLGLITILRALGAL